MAKFSEDERYCSECGKSLSDERFITWMKGNPFCYDCSHKRAENVRESMSRKREKGRGNGEEKIPSYKNKGRKPGRRY